MISMPRALHHLAPETRSNFGLLLFVCSSIALQMVLDQQDVIVRFSPIYWALVVPALVIPLWSAGQIIDALKGPAVAVLAFLICAGIFHSMRGDLRAVLQLILLVWVIAWCASDGVRISIGDLVIVFLASISLGILIGFTTDLNVWGVLPGNTYSDYGVWRVSFFPHVANTGILALIVFMFLTRDSVTALSYKLALLLCAYFLLFSFVRTVFVALALYLIARILFRIANITRPAVLFSVSLVLAIGSNIAEMYAVPILEFVQRSQIASRLLLRGASGLDPTAIYQQLYRPWLWSEHFGMFASSPDWMGLGTFNFLDHASHNILPGLGAAGSESFPTRLLATYGLPTIFFLVYLILALGKVARAKDKWACACFPAIVFMMMNWGSVFHPSNAFFVLFFVMLKGTLAISERPAM
jgi:hypothetical protein